MILALSLLAFQKTPKPADIMKLVIAKYRDVKALDCSFKTTAPGKKSELYHGTVNYKAKHHMNFSITDTVQECTAGEDLDAKGQGSTWVYPSDQRGYNDTLMDRHPYLIVRFIRDETKQVLSGGWLDKLETVTKGKRSFWRVRSSDDSDLCLTIDPANYRITEFTSAETYHPGLRLTTYVHYE